MFSWNGDPLPVASGCNTVVDYQLARITRTASSRNCAERMAGQLLFLFAQIIDFILR